MMDSFKLRSSDTSLLDNRGTISTERDFAGASRNAPLLPATLNTTSPASPFVVTNTNDSGAGSLRQAVLDANARAGRDEIVFRLGSGAKTITLTSGQLEIADDLFLTGSGRDRLTISGNNASRVFQIDSGINATLTGFTLANGQNNFGGGVWNAGRLEIRNSAFKNNQGINGGAIANGRLDADSSAVSLTLDNVQFTGNQGLLGGAINNLATLTVRRSTFSNNSSADSLGGGIFNQVSGTAIVDRSTFSNNSGRLGGGIANGGNLTVRNSTFQQNRATSGGGAIATTASQSFTIVDGSTFTGNTAIDGAGIYNQFGNLTVRDSTLRSNVASQNGGGIYNQGFAIVSYSSFTANTAVNYAGAIYNEPSSAIPNSLTLEFSTVENNRAAIAGGVFSSALNNGVRVKESRIRNNIATSVGADVYGGFISEGGNSIRIASPTTEFLNGVWGDRVDFTA